MKLGVSDDRHDKINIDETNDNMLQINYYQHEDYYTYRK
jgi:hypothetical protein